MEQRLNEIDVELRDLQTEIEAAEDTENLDALQERMNALITEKKGIEDDIEERRKEQEALERAKEHECDLKPIDERKEKSMETRNTKEYIEAYANYIKTGRDEECRALLSENVQTGTIPVPEFVDSIVQTAWERLTLLSRVRRTNFKGNLKVGIELSATGAEVHTEGGDAPDEESLVIYTAELVPQTFKKWVSFSDEILDMNAEAFLEYIYDEITYQIFLAVEKALLTTLASADATYDSNDPAPVVPVVSVSQIGLADFINAAGALKGEGTPVVITSRSVYAAYKGLAMGANYAADPFDGMDVIFADGFGVEDDDTVAFVGYPEKLHVNFVDGEDAQLKYDPYTLGTQDLVRVIGRLPVGLAYVGNYSFAKIAVEASA